MDALTTGKAPFLSQRENHICKANGLIELTPPKTVRLTMSGKALKGLNQLVAQIQLQKMNKTAPAVITFEQAQILNSKIVKGSVSFPVTSYNRENADGKRLAVYHLFSIADTLPCQQIDNKLQQIQRLTLHSEKTIVCKNSQSDKFLGSYLAACVTGRTLTVHQSTLNQFKQTFQNELEQCIAQQNHIAAFEIGKKASMECRSIMSKELKQERTQLYTYSRRKTITR